MKRTTYADSRTTGSGGICRAKCAGSNRCIANARYLHQLHFCNKVDCVCHGKSYLDSMRTKNRIVEGDETNAAQAPAMGHKGLPEVGT